MRRLILSLAACGAAVIGCNKSEPGGVTKPPTTGTSGSSSGKMSTSQSFKINAPTGASNIKQGATETFKVTLNKGSDFKEDVDLTFTAPEGSKLKVEPMKHTALASTDGTTSVTITADKESPLGKHTIRVDGKPKTGEATSVNFDVEVVKP